MQSLGFGFECFIGLKVSHSGSHVLHYFFSTLSVQDVGFRIEMLIISRLWIWDKV